METEHTYGLTTTEADSLRQRGLRIRSRLQGILATAIEVGQELADIRPRIPHGHWEDWLRGVVGISQSTAYNYTRVAAVFADSADLPIEYSAARKLSGTLMPDAVVIEAKAIARRGETVTEEIADEIVARHKGETYAPFQSGKPRKTKAKKKPAEPRTEPEREEPPEPELFGQSEIIPPECSDEPEEEEPPAVNLADWKPEPELLPDWPSEVEVMQAIQNTRTKAIRFAESPDGEHINREGLDAGFKRLFAAMSGEGVISDGY